MSREREKEGRVSTACVRGLLGGGTSCYTVVFPCAQPQVARCGWGGTRGRRRRGMAAV